MLSQINGKKLSAQLKCMTFHFHPTFGRPSKSLFQKELKKLNSPTVKHDSLASSISSSVKALS